MNFIVLPIFFAQLLDFDAVDQKEQDYSIIIIDYSRR